MELGFYERVIRSSNRKRVAVYKVLLGVLYALSAIVFLLWALLREISPALIVIALSAVGIAAFVSLGRIDPEYEYSINSSYITLAKIYGKRRRKELFETSAEKLLFVAPMNEENMKKALGYHPKEQYDVYLSASGIPIWLAVFEDTDEENILFVFEAEDEAIKLLRTLKPSVITYR